MLRSGGVSVWMTDCCVWTQVPQVTPSTSAVLPSLSVLRLGSNRLVSLSDGSFAACPVLTELYLDHNLIVSLSDHTFSGLRKLEVSLFASRTRACVYAVQRPLDFRGS